MKPCFVPARPTGPKVKPAKNKPLVEAGKAIDFVQWMRGAVQLIPEVPDERQWRVILRKLAEMDKPT